MSSGSGFVRIMGFWWSAIVVGLLLSGCGKDKVTTYEVPREKTAPAVVRSDAPGGEIPVASSSAPVAGAGMMAPLPGMSEQVSQFPAPEWVAPEHWEAQALGSMRKGSWLVKQGDLQADVSVLVFPGDVGGELANMNRWRQQLGLAPVDEAGLAQLLETVTIDGLPGKKIMLVTAGPIAGKTHPQATLGGYVEQGGGTWFFKLTGDRQLVEEETEAFLMFLKTVKFKQP